MMGKKKYGVILLSAGFGTRLRPITKDTPKVLVKVKGKPVLEHWLNIFNDLNNPPGELLINTHFLHKKVNSFIKNKKFNFKIKISHENKIRGSFGTMIHNYSWIKKFEKIIIIYTDILFTNNLNRFFDNFIKNKIKNDIIILSDVRKDMKNCGQLKFNKHNKLILFKEKPIKAISKYANSGLYLFKTAILLKLISNFKKRNGTKFADIAESLMPLLVEKAYVYVIKGKVVDIGTHTGLKKANQLRYSKKKFI